MKQPILRNVQPWRQMLFYPSADRLNFGDFIILHEEEVFCVLGTAVLDGSQQLCPLRSLIWKLKSREFSRDAFGTYKAAQHLTRWKLKSREFSRDARGLR